MGLNTRDAKINRTVNMPSESFPFFMLLSIHKVSFQINRDRERREGERKGERGKGGERENAKSATRKQGAQLLS